MLYLRQNSLSQVIIDNRARQVLALGKILELNRFELIIFFILVNSNLLDY